jgi:ADP-heptose:LPS heptosyltransferase
MMVHYDCRHFLGTKPCVFRRECEACPHYAPFGQRILIIKLAALGDVLRTTPLLQAYKEADPACHITWLTLPGAVPMLRGIPEIDRLLEYDSEAVLRLQVEEFDQLHCFDKEPKATALAMKVSARSKAGFGMTPYGNVMPLNRASEYMFHLGINDPLKFQINRKTYPELVFECAGLGWTGPREYLFPDLTVETEKAGVRLAKLGVRPDALKIGLNTGAGHVFATKKWTESGYAELADRVIETCGAQVLLLGGPAEAERNTRIAAAARNPLIQTGTDHEIRDFAGVVANCDLVVTGDTLAMHVAIGLHVPVVVILGSTCHQEIELYGRGAKIVSDFDCSPCYLSVCSKDFSCMQAIGAAQVFDVVERVLKETAETREHRGK